MNRKILLAAVLLCALTAPAYSSTFKEQLAALPGVVSIDEVVQDEQVVREKYIVWFEQPIDWASPDVGTFLQRVKIAFQDYDRVNMFYTNSRELSTSRLHADDRPEIAKMYDANSIAVEYRFYDKSIPAGLSKDKVDLWEHLTNENASKDFHNIIEQLKGILSGRWVVGGAGNAVNVFSHYFPNDAEAYVSYYPVFCDGQNDSRFFDAVYTTIGDEYYDAEQAKTYRDMLLELQVEAIRNRDYLQPRMFSADVKPRTFGNVSMDFEVSVIEYPIGVWQYNQNFASVDAILKMPRNDDPTTETNEREEYLAAMLELINVGDSSDDPILFPYIVKTALENGNYGLVTKYLRTALEREGLSMYMTEEDARDYFLKTTFTEEQYRRFKYDPSLRNEMLNWAHTTQSNVIITYATSNPWYFVRLPDVYDNPNVHIFKVNTFQNMNIQNMPDEQKAEITALLDEWLTNDAETPSTSSSSNCNAGFSFCGVIAALLLLVRRRV